MTTPTYSPPEIVDHGSLVDLTADFDLHFIGSVAKVVSMAAVSPVISTGIPSGSPKGGSGGVLENAGLGGGTPDGASDVLSDTANGGAPAGGGSVGAGGVAGAGAQSGTPVATGGDLPFTGYYATLVAATGAAAATVGATLRSRLRRKS